MNNFAKYYHKGNSNRTQRINEAMKCVKRANIKGEFMDYAELIDYLRSIMHIEKEIHVDDSRGINVVHEYLTASQIIFNTRNNDDVLYNQRIFTTIKKRCAGIGANLSFTRLSTLYSYTNTICVYNETRQSKIEENQYLKFDNILGAYVYEKHLKSLGTVDITLISDLQPIAYTLQIVI